MQPLDVVKDLITIGLAIWFVAAVIQAITEPSWSSIGTVVVIAVGAGIYLWRVYPSETS